MSDEKTDMIKLKYQDLLNRIANLHSQISFHLNSIQEHQVVIETLEQIPEDKKINRKCFVLVEEVLMNKSIVDAIKILSTKLNLFQKEKDKMEEELIKTKKEINQLANKNELYTY